MELDHLFLFTHAPEQVIGALHLFGFTEGTPNTHPGQGTSCRRFFFRNAYLEVLSVTSEEEIKSAAIAPTKLWERSQYLQTGYCPFGLCFRSDTIIFDEGWHYRPPFLPEGLYINVASNTGYPSEPMLFELPFSNTAPENYAPGRQQPLEHESGFSAITKVKLILPSNNELSSALQKVIQRSPVVITEGISYMMELEFDSGKMGRTHDFSPLVPLTIRW